MKTITLGNNSPNIVKTSDYNIFKRVEGNRTHKNPHIKRLMLAISKDAEVIKYNPILVNEKFEIIDGQHRFEAIKRLELPIYYIQVKGLSLTNAQDLNVLSKPWTPIDYAQSYSELGNKNYAIYLSFKSDFRLNHDILMRYLSLGDPITSDMFRTGKLKVKNEGASCQLCQDLKSMAEYYDRYNIRVFALAFKQVWSHPNYDHKTMLFQLTKRSSEIIDRGTTNDYIRDLEAIYNKGTNESSRLRFF